METLPRIKAYAPLLLAPPPPPANLAARRRRPGNIFFSFRNNQSHQNFRPNGLKFTPPLKQRITSRPLVARSELAVSGSANPPFSATGFQLGPRIRGVCFYAAAAAAAMPLFVAMVVAHPLVLLLDRYRRQFHHLIAKVWATMTIAPFYRFEFEGLENLPSQDTAAVFVANHQSFLDIYTLLTIGRSFKFISKTEIFVLPIVGWAMFLMGLIPLRRMDSRSQMDCLKRCIELVRKGASVFFFPEGTRSKDGKLGIFKKGAFSIAAKTGAPIVPISLVGTGNLMPPGMEGIVNKGSVKVVIHKPIEGTNADILCKQARDIVADTLILHGYGVHTIGVYRTTENDAGDTLGLYMKMRKQTSMLEGDKS